MFMPKLLLHVRDKKSNINVRFHVVFCMLIAHTKAEQWEFWGRFLALTISSRIYMYALNPEGGIFLLYMLIQIIFHCNIIITCENCYAQF